MTNRPRLGDYLLWAVVAVFLLTAFDHAMRVDQAQQCEIHADVPCPHGLWIWQSASREHGDADWEKERDQN